MTSSARVLTVASVATVATVALLTAGCGSSTSGESGTEQAAAPATSAACPSPRATGARWPAGVPLDLPVPPGSGPATSSVQPDGTTLVRFSTGDSLRNGVVALTGALGPAGYTLGRGDAEDGEADAPFTRGDLRGLFRLTDRGPCRTDWVLAVTVAPDTGQPLLPGPDEDRDQTD